MVKLSICFNDLEILCYFLIYIQYIYQFIKSDSPIKSNNIDLSPLKKKILHSMTLQYCTMPDRLKYKTKFSFCGSILWQDPNQFPSARNCVVLPQPIYTRLKVSCSGLGSCLNNSSIIVSISSLLCWTKRQKRRKKSPQFWNATTMVSWEHTENFFLMFRF